jgi:hypothetical protein
MGFVAKFEQGDLSGQNVRFKMNFQHDPHCD